MAGLPGAPGHRSSGTRRRRGTERPPRRGRPRGRRSPTADASRELRRTPALQGQVRPPYDPRSTLYNTDGQVFSDAGVPVVLFMENYDINRSGYHDTHDTMENIDLDYGAAVAAIVDRVGGAGGAVGVPALAGLGQKTG